MRKIWREVTRKMAAQFETWPTPRLERANGALELRNHNSGMHALRGVPTRRNRIPASLESFQTLHLNYSDQMAQFVFDVARHGDGMSDFLAQ